MLDFHSCDIFDPCLEKKKQKNNNNNNNNNNNTKNSKKTKQINTKLLEN